MADFPRTKIEDVSVSRLVMGTNWWLGFSHTSKAKDKYIQATMGRREIADIMEVFLNAGIDTAVGIRPDEMLADAITDAEDRTGRQVLRITTPHLEIAGTPEAEAENERILDDAKGTGAFACWPHQQTTDALLDRTTRTIRNMDKYCAMIRDRGMLPGLSTHMPEGIRYADSSGLDVVSYIQLYNAIGFLMQMEVDWVHKIIWEARKPVLAIKPLAAGRLSPLPGLAFAWSTIRECDMVAVGTSSPDEAREVIEISLAILERRRPDFELQTTRSKASVED